MSSPEGLFLALSAIVFMGFLGSVLFERTRVSETLPLIAFGVLLGPALGFLDPDQLRGLTSYIGPLALTIILFDGGINLKLDELARSLARASTLAVAGFTLSALLVAAVAHLLLGYSLMVGLLLGAILGGTSSVVVIPLVQRLGVPGRVATVLNLESALTDVLSVVVAITLVDAIHQGGDLQVFAQSVAASFSTAIILGLAAGLAWLRALRALKGRPFEYTLTMGALLLLYAGAQLLGGSGPIAVLTFGVVLGNGDQLGEALNKPAARFEADMARFHSEVSLFIRVFFFVYLGAVLELGRLDGRFAVASAALLLALVAARWLAVRAASFGDRRMADNGSALFFMFPRGLAAAALAAIPAGAPYHMAEAADFAAYAFAMILLTNLVATGGVLALTRRSGGKKERAPRAPRWQPPWRRVEVVLSEDPRP